MAFQRRQQPQQQQGQYDNTNKGVLFVNQDKQQENHPDRKGRITFQCDHCGAVQEHWLSAWDRDTKAGETISIAVGQPVDAAPQQQRVNQSNNFVRQNAAPRPQQRSFPQQQAMPRNPRQLPPQPRQRPSFDDTDDDIPYTP